MSDTGRVDVASVLADLDRVHASGGGPDEARLILSEALGRAEAAGDAHALLTLSNEAAGFHRSVSEHDAALDAAERALDLVDRLGLHGSEAEATTLINAATALRAAGRTDDARDTYAHALAVGERLWGDDDRRRAALHNNLSLALVDAGEYSSALTEQSKALAVLERGSVDPGRDIDIAMTHVNLATTASMAGDLDAQETHAARAIEILSAAGADEDPHAAAAHAAYAEVLLRQGRAHEAAASLDHALSVVARAYGTSSDAYRITAENLAAAREAAESEPVPGEPTEPIEVSAHDAAGAAREPHVPGLILARQLWVDRVRPMLAERYPDHVGRIAAGLVG
ncbi:MAG: tetratricopeptide repeat protein, partial [Demequina sp.]|uniref:tetratricopeptide repeat protein n=1 Tax=Demequina sp. TaxID=2050685 RepID=UPI003A88D5E1